MAVASEPEFVYYHECPALGKNAKITRALVTSSDRMYILYYQHKCPFCNLVRGGIEYAKGVTRNANGSYTVDINIAEKLR